MQGGAWWPADRCIPRPESNKAAYSHHFPFFCRSTGFGKTSTSEGKHEPQWTAQNQVDDLDFADGLVLLCDTYKHMQMKTTGLAAISSSILNLFGPIQVSNSSEFPERLRTTIKRINERLITTDNHQSILTGDRFSLPLHGPIELLHTLNPTDNNPTIGDDNINKREHQLIQIYVVAVESVIFLADILETVLLPHLTACLPDNKRGLALVFREQSLMAARQIREPCANELAPHLLNIIIAKMTGVATKNCKQLTATNSASITSSFSKIWPIGSNTNQQQQTIDKEPSIPNNNNSTSSPSPSSVHNNLIVSTSSYSIDILTMHICAMNWSTKEVANTPNPYVYDININVFHPLSLILQNISKEFHLQDHVFMIVIWKALLSCLASQLLEALSRVQQCSDEGRGQMLLDIQTLAVYAQSASKIRYV
ncbi:unnamed protein product [Schistosoma mattheei]|uniref:Uncharacterized protein n=1 Tax=Schistosoma mattheei TaxID=31246 RepID=A0A183PC10_9TREM|nr:unnamed protein product [Schistosoma mattheei]